MSFCHALSLLFAGNLRFAGRPVHPVCQLTPRVAPFSRRAPAGNKMEIFNIRVCAGPAAGVIPPCSAIPPCSTIPRRAQQITLKRAHPSHLPSFFDTSNGGGGLNCTPFAPCNQATSAPVNSLPPTSSSGPPLVPS